MFQVLIVDDEESVVEGVAVTLPCEQLGIKVIHKALSATEAFSILHNHRVDLLITDIRMPGMTGLELVQHVQETSRNTKSILLTGYADFNYAKQAISLGAINYLLKPVDDDELISAVAQALDKVKQEWDEVVSHQRTEQTLKENMPLLRRDLMIDLLQRKKKLTSQLQTLNIPISEGERTALLLVRMEEPFIHYDDYSKALIEYAIANISEEVLSEEYIIWSCTDPHGYLVFAVTPREKDIKWLDDKADILVHLSQQIKHNVGVILKGSVSVIVGTWGVFPSSLADSYEDALLTFRRHIGGGIISLESDSGVKKSSIRALYHLNEPPRLTDLLEAGRWDDFRQKVELTFTELEERSSGSGNHALEVYCAIAGALAYIANKSGYGLFDLISEGQEMLSFDSFHSIGQMHKWTLQLIDTVQVELEGEVENAHSTMIRRIRNYVEEHLSEDVSLQAIAQEVYLHPVYMSQLYKNITGEGISDYVLRLRMEKAAFQLKNSRKKVYEVAELAGYHNVPYFIKVFKRYFGKTPQEYRDNLS